MKKLMVLITLFAGMLFAIDFNTASKQELMQINGIGPKKAEAIIQYRKTHKIKSEDDLKNIKGFNNKSVDSIKKQFKKQNKFQKKIKNQKKNMSKKFNSKKDSLKKKFKGKLK